VTGTDPTCCAPSKRPELAQDERFADLFARAAHAAALVEILDHVLAARPAAERAEVFDREGVWCAPVQAIHELADDPQAAAAGCFVSVAGDGGERRLVATPVDFGTTCWSPAAHVPELGQDTEDILLELGYDWEAIGDLKDRGAVL